jgi:hypothetical protein
VCCLTLRSRQHAGARRGEHEAAGTGGDRRVDEVCRRALVGQQHVDARQHRLGVERHGRRALGRRGPTEPHAAPRDDALELGRRSIERADRRRVVLARVHGAVHLAVHYDERSSSPGLA